MNSQENLVAELRDDLRVLENTTQDLKSFIETIEHEDITIAHADMLERKADSLMSRGHNVYKTLIRNTVITK